MLKISQNSLQKLEFDGSIYRSFLLDAPIMVSEICPMVNTLSFS